LKMPLLEIRRQELVASRLGDPEGGLGEIVGSEVQELGFRAGGGDFIGDDAGAGQLDHGANFVLDRKALLDEDIVRDSVN